MSQFRAENNHRRLKSFGSRVYSSALARWCSMQAVRVRLSLVVMKFVVDKPDIADGSSPTPHILLQQLFLIIELYASQLERTPAVLHTSGADADKEGDTEVMKGNEAINL
ncbi:hypothetical protein ANN_18823 [Periplaneta americana]|uniref:Uncharacterized protein n=1 Tax=Periplaneta americana TaxID=6978 RepID=A0ABQ8SQB8_PERAM|nr:hypothetical protein ANN_18823 [Periplaneta americana]